MATFTTTLPAPDSITVTATIALIRWSALAIEVPAELAAGSSSIWLRRFDFRDFGTSSGVTAAFHTSQTGSFGATGPDLSDQFETNGTLTITFGDRSLVLPSSILDNDRGDPYQWLDRSLEADAYAVAQAINSATDRSGVTVTFDDGATPALPAPTPPSVTIDPIPDGNEGTTVRLTRTLSGGSYRAGSETNAWSVSGGTLDDATADSPTWTRPQVSADTDYNVDLTVTVQGDGTNHAGSATAAAATVAATVDDVPPVPVTRTEYAYRRAASAPRATNRDGKRQPLRLGR